MKWYVLSQLQERQWILNWRFFITFSHTGFWRGHCVRANASAGQNDSERARMYREIALTVLVPLCIVVVSLLAMAIFTKLKHWRKRRTIERGIADLVRRVRS
jgi:hypothetical protein